MNYGSTCPPFTALILIFAKATRENAADAGRGLNRGGGGGVAGTDPAGSSLDTLDLCQQR